MPKPDKTQEIRELRALVPENNQCINCHSKSPGYVCLTYSTFVCTKCAGIHRSLMHNIRSITLSTLTDSEMELMRAGGNAVAQRVWFANLDEGQNPRPNPEDESALRRFIRAAYVDGKWKSDGNGSIANAKIPSGIDIGSTPFAFDFSGSYAAAPPSALPTYVSAVPMQPMAGSDPLPFTPIDLPLESPASASLGAASNSRVDYHRPSTNGLDLISWDMAPDASTMPRSTIVEEVPRRPVYHVQHSSIPASQKDSVEMREVPLSSSPSVQSPPPMNRNTDLSSELQIKQLQDLLAAQQRQFQHQMQQQQLKERELQQQLQQTRMQSQLKDGQYLMAHKVAGSPPAGTMSVSPPPAGHYYPGSAPVARGGPMMGGQQHPSPQASQVPQGAPNASTIMVLGPNGQLVPLSTAQSGVAPKMTSMNSQAAPPPNAIGFTPVMNPNGTAMMAPATSPLMTLGQTSHPSQLPPGSIGPHYVPAPGGGYQAVYMVPSGTLPPNAAQKPAAAPPGTQRTSHNPVTYAPPSTHPSAQHYSSGNTRAPLYPNMVLAGTAGSQERDDFELALKLQREEDAAMEREAAQAKRNKPAAAPAPTPIAKSTGPTDAYFQDSYLANASYIANDEQLARQLAAAELSDDE